MPDDDLASINSDEEEEDDNLVSGSGTMRKVTKKKKPHGVLGMEIFLDEQLDAEIVKAMTHWHFYGEGDSDFIEWTILKDGEKIVENMMKPSQ